MWKHPHRVGEVHPESVPGSSAQTSGGENGSDAWVLEGKPMMTTGVNLVGRKTVPPDGSFPNLTYYENTQDPNDTLSLGAGGGRQRIREQDMDSIDAEVLFPPYCHHWFS